MSVPVIVIYDDPYVPENLNPNINQTWTGPYLTDNQRFRKLPPMDRYPTPPGSTSPEWDSDSLSDSSDIEEMAEMIAIHSSDLTIERFLEQMDVRNKQDSSFTPMFTVRRLLQYQSSPETLSPTMSECDDVDSEVASLTDSGYSSEDVSSTPSSGSPSSFPDTDLTLAVSTRSASPKFLNRKVFNCCAQILDVYPEILY